MKTGIPFSANDTYPARPKKGLLTPPLGLINNVNIFRYKQNFGTAITRRTLPSTALNILGKRERSPEWYSAIARTTKLNCKQLCTYSYHVSYWFTLTGIFSRGSFAQFSCAADGIQFSKLEVILLL